MIAAYAKSRVVVAALSVVAAAMIAGIVIFFPGKSDEVISDGAEKTESMLPTPPLRTERAAPDPNHAMLIRTIRDKERTLLLCPDQDAHFGYLVELLLELELRVTPDGRVADAEILVLVERKTRASNGSVTETRIPTDRIEKTRLARCVLYKAKEWRFPAFDGEPETVRVPLVLEGS
jgi:hypothetical protein